MKISTSKKIVAFLFTALCSAVIFQSCGGNDSNVSEAQLDELQKQLDATMQMYQDAKSKNGNMDKQLASKDSAINAQAAEIQRLINQLNNAKKQASTSKNSDVKDNSGRIDQLQKEIREKENKIKQLQKELDEQSAELKKLQKNNNLKQVDNSAEYKKQIADLQVRIADQEKQISTLTAEVKNLKEKELSGNDQMKKDYESQIASEKSKNSSLQSQITELESQMKTLKAEISVLQKDSSKSSDDASAAEIKSLRSEIATLSKKEASCRSQYEELVKNNQNMAQKCQNDKQTLQATITDLRQQLQQLQQRVDKLTFENEALSKSTKNGQNESETSAKTIADLNAQVESQRKQIEQLQNDLKQKDKELAAAKKASEGTGNNSKQLATVNQKLAELQTLCEGYVAEIERLKAENEQLKGENAKLKDKISSSADLIAENERLQQKVKLASVLVTSDVIATPGKSVKIGNVVKPTTKASQTKVVRIDCRLMDNNVIDPGSLTIYARISDASNRVICNGNPENYIFDMNGTQMQYTVKQDIEFTGYGRNLTLLWKKNDSIELAPGLYWVKLYCGGYEIGKVSFKLN